VLQALRDQPRPLTVIVSIAYEGEQGDDIRHRLTGATVEDLRRSLEALTGEEGALLRAIARPLTVEHLGRHPLGNLVLASVAAAFDDYGRASLWLGEELGAVGAVLPATVGPVRIEIDDAVGLAPRADGLAHRSEAFGQLRFLGTRIDAPEACVDAISHAYCVVLAPGSLYRSVLSTAAVPALASALQKTSAPVVWLANLEPDIRDAPQLSSIDYVHVLHRHGIRLDLVLHDPAAGLRFDPVDLRRHGVESLLTPLQSSANPGLHDSGRLRVALSELLGGGSLGPAGT
jgi:uncharacterized cofD-like protein